jgi:3-deoxy-manno-octulosonate cytidylyltransferase (CMP-KDO synthetase)
VSYTVIVPARLGSTRLPGKPLADIAGRPMVVRVAQRAARSSASRVVVAADDAQIVAACAAHGVEAILTRRDHATGSDRLAEACDLLQLDDDVTVVNVQGDEPLLAPALIDACAELLQRRPDCAMATVAHPIDDADERASPHVVKVVLDASGTALYFSRATIPFDRSAVGNLGLPSGPPALRHIGLYAYAAAFVRRFPTLGRSPLEEAEGLEQLRVLWHGLRIAVHVTAMRPGPGVDTAEDLARVRALYASTSH